MIRKSSYRPRLMTLEDRLAPGTILASALDQLVPLDPALASMERMTFDRAGSESAVLDNLSDSDLDWTVSRLPSAFGQLSPSASYFGRGRTELAGQDLGNPERLLGNGHIQGTSSDFVDLAVVTGSSIQVGSLDRATFGDDAGSARFSNVEITNDGSGAGTLSVAQADIGLPSTQFSLSGIRLTGTLIPMSDATGTYDRNTGAGSASLTFTIQLSSGSPGFQTCQLPSNITITLSTETTGDISGQEFTTANDGNGYGQVVDNSYAVPALVRGACGGFMGVDYATQINMQVGLPSASGANDLVLAVRMEPSIGP